MIQRQDYYFYWSSPHDELPPWLIPFSYVIDGEMWVRTDTRGSSEMLTNHRWVRWHRGDKFVSLVSVTFIERVLNGESNERLAEAYE